MSTSPRLSPSFPSLSRVSGHCSAYGIVASMEAINVLAVRSFQLNGGHALIRLHRPNWARCVVALVYYMERSMVLPVARQQAAPAQLCPVRPNCGAVPPFCARICGLREHFVAISINKSAASTPRHDGAGRAACRQRAPCKILGIFLSCFGLLFCFVCYSIFAVLLSSGRHSISIYVVVCGIVWLCAYRKIPADTG